MIVPQVRAREVADRLKRGDKLVLLDVREHDELALCRIEGAAHIPLGQLSQRLNQLSPEDEIVLFCHHGKRSLAGAALLQQQGFAKAMSMMGGIDAWSVEIDPRVSRY
ncbi:putative adenylyltransferase/sulfurtransferase MoeZ [Phycisphaerae bacterium RAS1]|nr:putative adenylyltransferase/sulfurtransferase MoeZ [Phycisphaerae bacterium RAS1]